MVLGPNIAGPPTILSQIKKTGQCKCTIPIFAIIYRPKKIKNILIRFRRKFLLLFSNCNINHYLWKFSIFYVRNFREIFFLAGFIAVLITFPPLPPSQRAFFKAIFVLNLTEFYFYWKKLSEFIYILLNLINNKFFHTS